MSKNNSTGATVDSQRSLIAGRCLHGLEGLPPSNAAKFAQQSAAYQACLREIHVNLTNTRKAVHENGELRQLEPELQVSRMVTLGCFWSRPQYSCLIDQVLVDFCYLNGIHFAMLGDFEESYEALIMAFYFEECLAVGIHALIASLEETTGAENANDSFKRMMVKISQVFGGDCRRKIVSFLSDKITCSCLEERKRAFEATPEERLCSFCGKVEEKKKLLRCSRCRKVFYCDQECQRQDWSTHKKNCEAIRDMRKFLKTIEKEGLK